MQRRTIVPIFFVGFVLLASCLSTPLQATADGDADGMNTMDATTISAAGTDKVATDAGLAVVSITMTTTAGSADEARGTIVNDVAAVRAALTDTGTAEDAVQTTGFNIYPEYDYSGQERELLGYHAAHALRIEIALDHAGEVVDLAVGASASEVRGVALTLTDEKRAEFREEALTRAVDSTKADADSVADTADLTVTGVHTTTVGGGASPGPYPVAYAEDAARASSGPTELSPGPVTVSAAIQMVYEAESE